MRRSEVTASRESGRQRPKGYADWKPHAKTRALLGQVDGVLEEYRDHWPVTVRQVFYRLAGAYGYEKSERAYERLAEKLVMARRARRIPFDALRDDGVSVINQRSFGEPADFWDHVAIQARHYRRDKQAGQRAYVELWCEATGMMPQLALVAGSFSVPVFSCGSGFASLTAVRSIVDRAVKRDVPTVLLHVGDYDPSGVSIFESIVADATAFLGEDAVLPGIHYVIPDRVALTAEQVEQYELPTSPAKASDSRAAKWKGATCQAEALPPDMLADVVRVAIERHLDRDLLDEHGDAEQRERVQLLSALPRGEAA